ncbi:MBL fold metallo-hydrolase [Clostridium sp.]|uniref:MBL fold metallo-hydrolase n=1 Tax=Clostridium sp. TaxID=1506 RepID=UPI003F31DD7D
MIVKTLPVGSYQANCYIIKDENSNKAAIVDPGANAEWIIKSCEEVNAEVDVILLTHAHFDHDGAVEELKAKYNVPVYMHKEEENYMNIDTSSVFGKLSKVYEFINDNDTIKVGTLEFKCIHTPGHTKGGMCFLVNDKVFTGDTLFQGSIGRTDFIGGSFDEIIKSIEEKLMVLDKNVEVYPGHGPKSTIIFERMRNPFLA